MTLLQRLLGRIVDVRKDEIVTALLMFAYAYLAMTAYNIIQPLTRSKLISSLGAVNVPWVIFGSGLFIGVLMLGCGNTSVMWAEQYIPSGLAALLVTAIPLFAALIEMALPRGEGLSLRGWVGIWVGLVAMVFLLWPELRSGLHGDSREIVAAAVTLGGTLCWTAASVISRRSTIRISGVASAGLS